MSLLPGARSARRGPGTCARCSHSPGGRGAHRGSWSCPSAARAARISEAPARRSPISTSAPLSRDGPAMAAWCVVDQLDVGAHLAQLAEPLEAVLEDRLVDARRARRPGSAARTVGGWRSVARPGYGAVSMSAARKPPAQQRACRRRRSCPCRRSIPHPDALERSRGTPRGGRTARVRAGRVPPVTAAATTNVPASIRSGMTAVVGAAQAPLAVDLDRVRVGPLDLGAHLAAGTRSGRRPRAPGRRAG